jgi:serine protease Do
LAKKISPLVLQTNIKIYFAQLPRNCEISAKNYFSIRFLENTMPDEISFTNTESQGGPNQPLKAPKVTIITVAIVSLVAGVIGGAFGGAYLSNSPQLANVGLSGSQNITVNEDSAITEVVEKASPAVVSIVVTKDLNKIPGFGTNDDYFFPFFFGNPEPNTTEPNLQQVGAGSGFFISADGLILTNKHVISDPEASYTVVTQDQKIYETRVLAQDPRNDLAILKIEINNAPFLSLADSSQIKIGQRAIAIGNSLGQYQNTVTTGVVSGIGRSITAGGPDGSEQLEGVIQTDAAINPGNSGGPLLNIAGQVIGINTAVDQEGQLVGFAIPSNDAKIALDSFRSTGRIVRPYIGVRYIMITPALAESENLASDYGALIIRGDSSQELAILPGSPAEKAGLKEDSIILEVDGTKVDGENNLARMLRDKKVGDTITLRVYQDGSERDVRVTLEEAK